MKFNCIAVDSKMSNLNVLTHYLSTLHDFNPLITFTDPMLALKSIIDMSNIDLLLMDIEMLFFTEKDLISLLSKKIKKS